MRCPRCGATAAAGDYCSACGDRLFAWLGDPFGAMELSPQASGATTASARAGSRPSTAKILVGVLVISGLVIISPAWAAALLVALLVVLRRWPDPRWLPWSLFLGGVAVLALVTQPAALRTLTGGGPRPAATSLPARPPAVVTATVVARRASAAYDRGSDLWRAGESLAAIDAFTEAIVLRPEWSDPYNDRAMARVSAGQLDAALDDAQRAVELDVSASRVSTLDTRAYVSLKCGDYEAALVDYNAARARQDLVAGLRLAADLKLEQDPQLADVLSATTRTVETLPPGDGVG